MTCQSLLHVALVVREYDEALAFYVGKLGFDLIEDTYQPAQDKRWVVVAPPCGSAGSILLARASSQAQESFIGDQAGGRVFLFLKTNDLDRDHARYLKAGIEFVRPPTWFDYGKVAVFKDLYGNLWDLVEHAPDHPLAERF